MQPASDDSSALTWGLRRYWRQLLAMVLAVAVAAVAVSSWLASRAEYTASARVIASELQVSQEQLPRLGESVFNSGSVAREVATALGVADHRTLVPDRISIDPIPETIAFRVLGHSDDATEAAQLADEAKVVLMHPDSVLPRHLLPPAFVAGAAAVTALATVRPKTLGLLAPYAAALGVASVVAGRGELTPRERTVLPAAFAAMHVSWGIGFWRGLPAALRARRATRA